MGLKERLRTIFKEEDEKRIKGMCEALKGLNIYKEDDLIYLDEDTLKKTEYFQIIEIRKLLANITDKALKKSLKKTLKDIFGKISSAKFSKIESYFKENEVCSAIDLTLFDLDKIASRKDIFSDLDVQKIRNYIQRTNVERFQEIKRVENFKRTTAEEMQKQHLKKQESDNENRSKYIDSKLKEREILINHRCNLETKSADLANTYTQQGPYQRQSSELSLVPAASTAIVFGELALGTVHLISDTILHSFRALSYANNQKILEQKAKEVVHELNRLDCEIETRLGMSHALEAGDKIEIKDVSDLLKQ